MLIDDNEIDNLINQKMIESASITDHIYIHTGAKSAIEFLRNMEKLDLADKVLPDVIFLDIDMPLMDGFQATAAIRKQEQEHPRRTPIIAMTAHALPEDREKCLAAGMDDYLPKPINEANLVSTIERWVRHADVASPSPAETLSRQGDRIQIRAMSGLEDLIPGYLVNRRNDLVALAMAVNSGDLSPARVIGHGMKGSGTGYGFPAITEIGRNIEQSALNQDIAGVKRQICELEDYLQRVDVLYSENR